MQDEKEWELNEGGRLKMICRFREISDLLVAEPFFLNCNNRCHEGLQPTKNPRACHLCGEGSVLNMMRRGVLHFARPEVNLEGETTIVVKRTLEDINMES